MSITRDKAKGAYRFEFKRVIGGRRRRATKLLPKTWTEAQAYDFDVKETARLYAMYAGMLNLRPKIEDAVLIYLSEHVHELKTAKDYEYEYASLLPLYEGKYLSELPAVCRAVNKLELKPASRRKKIRMLCAACTFAFKHYNMGESNPSSRVIVPRVNNSREVVPSRKQMLQIARKCRRRDARAAIIVAYYSGMRQGEIRRAVVHEGVFRLYDTKNGRQRFVPMHPKLRVYTKQFPMDVLKTTLYAAWRDARDRLGLSHLHFHDLRHSTGTELINSGVDLFTTGQVLGHLDPRSTQRYAHMMLDTLRVAVNKIGARAEKATPQEE